MSDLYFILKYWETHWKISADPPAASMPLFSASASFCTWPYMEYYIAGSIRFTITRKETQNIIAMAGYTNKHNSNLWSHFAIWLMYVSSDRCCWIREQRRELVFIQLYADPTTERYRTIVVQWPLWHTTFFSFTNCWLIFMLWIVRASSERSLSFSLTLPN